MMSINTLAIDFGTSNSAAAVMDGAHVRRLQIEPDAQTLPTAIFFPSDAPKNSDHMLMGNAAGEALIAGDEGRYMRALKSVLGTSLFREPRMVGNKRRTIEDIVTSFLAALKQRAETQSGQHFTHVMSGRPVHFHSNDPARDARAEADLRACYQAAGFEHVEFMFEPEAAALASHAMGKPDELGLIVDIGGGTSDFTVFRSLGSRVETIASHGIRLGGTDFDHAISMSHAMPLLGHGGQLRRVFGEGLLPVPLAIYVELSTWAKIPFLYTRDTQRAVEEMQKLALAPRSMARLANVIEDQLGHELAFAVEAGKVAANAGLSGSAIDMSYIEAQLSAPISTGTMNGALTTYRDTLRAAIYETLQLAGTMPSQITSVILVGGSSLMNIVSEEARTTCPTANILKSEAFTAVVDGLALATQTATQAR